MEPQFTGVYEVKYRRLGGIGYRPISEEISVLAESVEDALAMGEQYLEVLDMNSSSPGSMIFEVLGVTKLFEVYCGLAPEEVKEFQETVEDALDSVGGILGEDFHGIPATKLPLGYEEGSWI